MKLWIPPNTLVQQIGHRVVLIFDSERNAEQFAEFLKWLDEQPSGVELVVNRPEEKEGRIQ